MDKRRVIEVHVGGRLQMLERVPEKVDETRCTQAAPKPRQMPRREIGLLPSSLWGAPEFSQSAIT